jgi:hypothetical protein
MRLRKRIILLAIFFTGLPITIAVSQNQFVDDLPLMMPQLGDFTKTIPIYSYHDTLYVMTADYDWDDGSCFEKRGHSWHLKFDSPAISQGMEFIVSPQGGLFVYDPIRNFLMFDFSDTVYQERYCPGKPVIDQNNRIHIIQGYSGNYIYGISDDTLNSIIYVDTLSNFPDFQRLVATPDNSIMGAVFFDFQNERIFKFLSNDGFIDFSDSLIFQADSLGSLLYDMTLDNQGKLVALIGFSFGFSQAHHSVWTENYGLKYLYSSSDEVLEPIHEQVTLHANNNDIIIIGSRTFYINSDTWFYYSSDGGDSWDLSLYEIPNISYGSSPRNFDDTLRFVYLDGNNNWNTYYYPVPVDSIADNLTSINDEEIIPENISLLRAYPNPFNARTTIEFALAEPGDAELTIYDITGAKVETIRRPGLEAGKHSVVWDAADVASGVYFARLEAGRESRSIKMVLLK